MRQQTCKPFARQNKNKQNGFSICYHFAIKREMRFSKSECFQGFSAHHIHFFLIPTRQKSGEQCIYDFSDMKEGTSPEDIGLVEMTRSAVIGEDDSDLEELDDPSRIPPGRGI